jgi:hypothetical protein
MHGFEFESKNEYDHFKWFLLIRRSRSVVAEMMQKFGHAGFELVIGLALDVGLSNSSKNVPLFQGDQMLFVKNRPKCHHNNILSNINITFF